MTALRSAVLAVSLLALAAPAGAAPQQAWDQAKVTELGKQLAVATDDLWNTFRRQPRPTVGQGQANSFFRLHFFDILRHFFFRQFFHKPIPSSGRLAAIHRLSRY